MRYLIFVLEEPGGPHSAAYAHRDDSVFEVIVAHMVENLGRKDRARCPQGVS